MIGNKFQLKAPFKAAGDQPQAIKKLITGLNRGYQRQTLLGVTGSGKTYTMASVIARLQKPALIISHNKTLAAQLAEEFRAFFPDNAVAYFVSYYDYYQPEAYLARTDTYIAKDASINKEIDRLRHSAMEAILTRRDTIVVASVSCIYGLGSPANYFDLRLQLNKQGAFSQRDILQKLTALQYIRNDVDLPHGTFRVRGDIIDIHPSGEERLLRIESFGRTIERLLYLHDLTGDVISEVDSATIFPATFFITNSTQLTKALSAIKLEMANQVDHFTKCQKLIEAQRIAERTTYDLEMIQQVGVVSGIENYSRHIDGRQPGQPPTTLLDYFIHAYGPQGFLVFADESHMTIPQVSAMYGGDKARKDSLIEFGFRLPSARDNRPLKFNEFEDRLGPTIFVSATPSQYELNTSKQIVEQVVRPTGLLDPTISVRPLTHQVDDIINEIQQRIPSSPNQAGAIFGRKARAGRLGSKKNTPGVLTKPDEKNTPDVSAKSDSPGVGRPLAGDSRHSRVLITTLTKRMAEELSTYLIEMGIKCAYLHSDVDTMERLVILHDLRLGKYDVLVGINLLREGLDLPEVSLVAIMDADKEGFLRSSTTLVQTMGRAARHLHGQVIMYADRLTGSMQQAIDETNRRRAIQQSFNKRHHITPRSIQKAVNAATLAAHAPAAAPDLDIDDIPPDERARIIKELSVKMELAARNLEFEQAATLRDTIKQLRQVKNSTRRI